MVKKGDGLGTIGAPGVGDARKVKTTKNRRGNFPHRTLCCRRALGERPEKCNPQERGQENGPTQETGSVVREAINTPMITAHPENAQANNSRYRLKLGSLS